MNQIPQPYLDYDDGLEKAILFILSYHLGSVRAIGREALVLALVKMGQGTGERAVRECVKHPCGVVTGKSVLVVLVYEEMNK